MCEVPFKFDTNTDNLNWTFELGAKLEINSLYRYKEYPNWQYLISKKATQQLIEELHDDLMLIRSE